MSAYCRYMWDRQFFVRYSIGIAGKGKGKEREMPVDEPEDVPNVTGQLMVKVRGIHPRLVADMNVPCIVVVVDLEAQDCREDRGEVRAAHFRCAGRRGRRRR
jgi:hypothetical protein